MAIYLELRVNNNVLVIVVGLHPGFAFFVLRLFVCIYKNVGLFPTSLYFSTTTVVCHAGGRAHQRTGIAVIANRGLRSRKRHRLFSFVCFMNQNAVYYCDNIADIF